MEGDLWATLQFIRRLVSASLCRMAGKGVSLNFHCRTGERIQQPAPPLVFVFISTCCSAHLWHVPVYCWVVPHFVFIHSVYSFTCFGHVGCFQLWAVTNKITLNECLYGHVLSFLLGRYLTGWLDHNGKDTFSLLETVRLFSKVIVSFYILTNNVGEFQLNYILVSPRYHSF